MKLMCSSFFQRTSIRYIFEKISVPTFANTLYQRRIELLTSESFIKSNKFFFKCNFSIAI